MEQQNTPNEVSIPLAPQENFLQMKKELSMNASSQLGPSTCSQTAEPLAAPTDSADSLSMQSSHLDPLGLETPSQSQVPSPNGETLKSPSQDERSLPRSPQILSPEEAQLQQPLPSMPQTDPQSTQPSLQEMSPSTLLKWLQFKLNREPTVSRLKDGKFFADYFALTAPATQFIGDTEHEAYLGLAKWLASQPQEELPT